MEKGRLLGCGALVASSFLWATAYIAVKQVVDDVPPALLLAFRYTLAALILAAICIPRFKKYFNKDLLFSGIKMGVAMFFEFYLFTAGLQFTTASKSSFLIASYIIILPLVYLIIRRKKPTGSDVLSSVICMVGICLLLANGLSDFNKGDALCTGCAVAYAVHIVYSAKFSKQYDGWLLNLTQFGTVAVLAWVVRVAASGYQMATGGGQLLSGGNQTLIGGAGLLENLMALPWGAFLFLAVVCSIIPYFMTLFGMKRVSTTTSGILLSFESVFATLLAVIMLGDPIYWQLIAGGAVIIASSIVSEFFANRVGKRQKEALAE